MIPLLISQKFFCKKKEKEKFVINVIVIQAFKGDGFILTNQ
jgi:hypothetical protein